MAGALLRSGTLRDYNPLGAVGSPVYGAASQLRAAIRRQGELGPAIADLFAIPKKNERGDVIDWYAPTEGDVVPWSAATVDERGQAKAALLAGREKLAAKADELQRADDSERQVFGRLLAQAMQVPGDDHVYLVNGAPVITFWGFRAAGSLADADVIGGLDTTAQAAGPVQPAGAAPVPESVAAGEPHRSRWWWWLLPLLLLILLLLLLIGLKSCGVDVPFSSQLPTIPWLAETAPPLAPPPGTPPLETGVVIDRPAVGVDGSGGTGIVEGRHGIGVTGPSADATVPAEKAGEGAVMPPVDATQDKSQSPQIADGGQPAGQAKTPDAAKKPLEPGSAAPADAASPKPQIPQPPPGAIPPQAGAAGVGKPLTIPDTAVKEGSTAFLEGDWRSITGLRDRAGNPVTLNYSFKNGQGAVSLERTVGGATQKCAGLATAAMKNGQLSIDQRSVICADGTAFNDSRVQCSVGAGGQAECRGVNADGTGYDVRIVK